MRCLPLLWILLLPVGSTLAAEDAGLPQAQTELAPGETLEEEVSFGGANETAPGEDEEEVVFTDESDAAGTVNAGFPEHDYQMKWLLLPTALLGLAALNTRWRKTR